MINNTYLSISKAIRITIGAKSIYQIVVGIIFLILKYIGLIISLINLNLILIQNNVNHDKIISIKINNFTESKNIYIV
jgi:hypothetical protein